MHNIFRVFLGLLILMSATLSHAHDINIATFQIRHLDNDLWVYEVMTPLYGLDQSLKSFVDDSAKWSALAKGSTEYKEQLVAYLKSGFRVQASTEKSEKQLPISSKLTLGKGKIKLDDHLSVFIFEIKGMPKKVAQLDFEISHMSKNASQYNVLRLIDGDQSKKYILNSKNIFSASDKGFFK